MIPDYNLLHGRSKSCGKCNHSGTNSPSYKTGESQTRLYGVWDGLRRRCNDIRSKRYKDYGGRGIKLCSDWEDYLVFKKMGYTKWI